MSSLFIYVMIGYFISQANAKCVQAKFKCQQMPIDICDTEYKDCCKWNTRKNYCAPKYGLITKKTWSSLSPEEQKAYDECKPDKIPKTVFDCSPETLILNNEQNCKYVGKGGGGGYCEWKIDDIFKRREQYVAQHSIETDIGENNEDNKWEIYEIWDGSNLHYTIFDWEYDLKKLAKEEITYNLDDPYSTQAKLSRSRMTEAETDARVDVKTKAGKTSKPYTRVGLMQIKNWQNLYETCTGTLFHKKWVVTAAHCVSLKYGDIGKPGHPEPGFIFKISTFRFWPSKSQEIPETERKKRNGIEYAFDESEGIKAINIVVSHEWLTGKMGKKEYQKYDFALIELETEVTFNPSWMGYGYLSKHNMESKTGVTIGYPGDKSRFEQHKSFAHVAKIQDGQAIDSKYITGGGQSGSALFYWKALTFLEKGIFKRDKVHYSQYIIAGTLSGEVQDMRGQFESTRWCKLTPIKYYLMKYLTNRKRETGNILGIKIQTIAVPSLKRLGYFEERISPKKEGIPPKKTSSTKKIPPKKISSPPIESRYVHPKKRDQYMGPLSAVRRLSAVPAYSEYDNDYYQQQQTGIIDYRGDVLTSVKPNIGSYHSLFDIETQLGWILFIGTICCSGILIGFGVIGLICKISKQRTHWFEQNDDEI